MLVRGSVPASHWDWQAGADFRYSKWEGEDAGASAPGPASSMPGAREDGGSSGDEASEGGTEVQRGPSSTFYAHASSVPGTDHCGTQPLSVEA